MKGRAAFSSNNPEKFTIGTALQQVQNKWRAVAAQTARCRSEVLSVPHTLIIIGPTKGSGTEDISFAEKSGK